MKKAFSPVIDENATLLILGTMPGEKSLQLQEYYGNRGNQFWKIMFEMFNIPLSQDYADRLALLKEKGIGVWDVLQYCQREGSLDSNIKNEVANDFVKFYATYPGIKTVFFSSKNAATYYDKYVGRKEGIHYEILPSPSGANATKPYAIKLKEWKEKILPLIIH